MRAERPPSRSPLPAPYRSPWLQLGHDLAALAAWLRLKLRELWRRNREGSLWRPPFWPEAGASLFWPLLLALLLASPLAFVPAGRSPRARSGPQPPAAQTEPPPELPAAERQEREVPPPSPPAESGATDEPPLPRLPEESTPAGTPSAAEPTPPADPLLAALEPGEDPPLIGAVRSHPARALLELRLEERYGALAAPQRRERAERWLARSRELGFEAIELRDRSGALLGRSALVGSGMILLDPDPA